MNRNEGLHSVLRGKLNRLVRKIKEVLEEYGDADGFACDDVVQDGLDIMSVRIENTSNESGLTKDFRLS